MILTQYCFSDDVPYSVRFSGEPDDEIEDLLKKASRTVELKINAPATLNLLRLRAESDIPVLTSTLRSQGYLESNVTVLLQTNRNPVRIVFQVDAGPVYKMGEILVEDIQTEKMHHVKAISKPVKDKPAKETVVHQMGDTVLFWLKQHGYPFPEIIDRVITVDSGTKRVNIHYQVDPGTKAYYGPVSVAGLTNVQDRYIYRMIPWQEGALYNIRQLKEFERDMLLAGIFSSVRISAEETNIVDEIMPIQMRFSERKHRTIRVGVNYRTDVGFGTRLQWENRNIFKQAERLELLLKATEIGYAQEGTFQKPGFINAAHSLVFKWRFAEDRPEAYVSKSGTAGVGIEREFGKERYGSLSIMNKYAQVEQLGQTDKYNLIGLPLFVDWNYSNDLLDPTEGGRWIAELTPYKNTLDEDLSFLKTFIEYRHYFSFDKLEMLTLAGRATLGMIFGAPRDSIPADERYYAGGGGSVRGYKYQSIGEQIDEQPIGGNSITEISVELRMKMNKHIGFVVFSDGGMVYEENTPTDLPWQWSAGLGARYYSPIGPFRCDLAFPLNPRDNDPAFQFYISLGQAF